MERNEKGQLIKGHSAPSREEALKLSRSLSKSWKNRDDYIGDIVNEHPRIYTSWRAFRFTEKGKKVGCVPEWKDFRTFYNDVVGTYSDGLVLGRKNLEEPWGPDNFMWLTPDEVGDLKARTFIEYGGKTLSLKQWSKELGVSLAAIKLRYYRHRDTFTTEEILFGKVKKRNDKKPRGIYESTTSIRAKASKMVSSYKVKDKKLGVNVCDIDIDWMIENILLQPCHYCGDTYRIGCDRIDNTKGHSKDNVIPCCYECNVARGNNFTYEEMRRLGKTIAEIKADWPPRESPLSKSIEEERKHDFEYRRQRNMKRVCQYSLDGTYIQTFPSLIDAAEFVGGTAKQLGYVVNSRMRRKGHEYFGYLWFKEIDIPPEEREKQLAIQ